MNGYILIGALIQIQNTKASFRYFYIHVHAKSHFVEINFYKFAV